jgi:hypothetical protein
VGVYKYNNPKTESTISPSQGTMNLNLTTALVYIMCRGGGGGGIGVRRK